ncbi:hypothetical protein GGTG_03973 [Gaeumannomyces tritici R3-111a-1]|uniref:Alternative oxidase n=1 Tax=Gaeumannomyces tritici (strain R3-111a-1) TaxID=644352 RepID=J3NRS3_GAET3|nr:hypothetical protein GGTG_03973 [Gaeumannomyces tritici R3-111a-1]EJT78879.1 hypothetical protein GGTG_03973 [Gaeumannomyces tritici R3-111a-1]
MVYQRRVWTTLLFSVAAFFPFIIIWNTFLDIGGALPELFRGSLADDLDDAKFVELAAAVEFPTPIDYAPIREVCTRGGPSHFRPGLLFSCEGEHGGIGMVRNQILKCIRYAMHGGGALVVPSMAKRNPGDVTDIETANDVPLEYLFDRQAFVRHLTAACPEMRLFDRAGDFPSYSQLAGNGRPLQLVGDEFERGRPEGAPLQHPREWRRRFDEWLGGQPGVQQQQQQPPSADRPVHVEIGQSFLEYPVQDDGPAFAREFGKLLPFRPDARELAARVLLALRRRCGLRSIDPTRPVSPGAFFGAHLRLERDAVWAWSPDEWRFGRARDQFEEQARYAARTGLGVVYVASGNETVVDMLAGFMGARRGLGGGHGRSEDGAVETRRRRRSRIQARSGGGDGNVTVVTKLDLLQGDDLALLQSLTFDQQALVDFLVMFKASAFMGVAHSSFSWNVALRRHEMSAYAGIANEGSDLLRDEYSIIMGAKRDYPRIDPFASAMWP